MTVESQRRAEIVAAVLERLDYDPLSGEVSWKPRLDYRGKQTRRSKRKAGCVCPMGYIAIAIGRSIRVRAHTAAWIISTGGFPAGEIDHINGNRADNRLVNLRDVPRVVNCENRRAASIRSKTQLLGAHWSKVANRYTSQIRANGRRISLGLFDTAHEAHAAYVAAKRRLHEGCTI